MKILRKITGKIVVDIKESGWAFAAFLMYYLPVHAIFGASCPMLVMTGLPCAGCGLTRAVLFLMRGQVLRAADINPSVFPVILFVLYWGYLRFVKDKTMKGKHWTLGLLVVCMTAIYVYRMFLYFPDKAPYVYHRDNMAARWIPGYGRWMRQVLNSIRTWQAG